MNILKRLAAALSVLVLVIVCSPAATAQNNPGSGLSISPTLSEFTIKPGQAETLSIDLKNITTNKITAKSAIYDFEAGDQSGNPKLITDPKNASPNSIRKFVLGLEDVSLDVGQQKKISLALQIPKDTPPGAYFGVVLYKAVPAGQNAPGPGELSLSASVGTIALITVPGNLREQVQLTGLHIYRGGHDGSLFFNKPTQVGVEIRNLGNGFAKPFGVVEIQKSFGKKVYSYQLNNTNPRANILPNSSRVFRDGIKGIGQVGRYTVTASISYGSGSQVLTLKKTFWYIPLWVAIVVLVVLLALAYLVFRTYRRYRTDRKRAYRRR